MAGKLGLMDGASVRVAVASQLNRASCAGPPAACHPTGCIVAPQLLTVLLFARVAVGHALLNNLVKTAPAVTAYGVGLK